MPAYLAKIEVPEGWEPKYKDGLGHAVLSAPIGGDYYLDNTIVLTAQSSHDKDNRFLILKKTQTGADKVLEWWPPYLLWEWFAVDSTGVAYFYTGEPVIADTCRWADENGLWANAKNTTEHLACGPPPEFEGDWKESKVKNPHL